MADYREILAQKRAEAEAEGRDLSPSATRPHSINDHQIDNARAVIREYEMVKDDPYLLREWKKASTGNLRNIKRLQNAQRLLSRVTPESPPVAGPPAVEPPVAGPPAAGPPEGGMPYEPPYGPPPQEQRPPGPVGGPMLSAEIPTGPAPSMEDMAPDYNVPQPRSKFDEYIRSLSNRRNGILF